MSKEDLDAKIHELGDTIRKLKLEGASKDDIKGAVCVGACARHAWVMYTHCRYVDVYVFTCYVYLYVYVLVPRGAYVRRA